jgi:hypothetical protein
VFSPYFVSESFNDFYFESWCVVGFMTNCKLVFLLDDSSDNYIEFRSLTWTLMAPSSTLILITVS